MPSPSTYLINTFSSSTCRSKWSRCSVLASSRNPPRRFSSRHGGTCHRFTMMLCIFLDLLHPRQAHGWAHRRRQLSKLRRLRQEDKNDIRVGRQGQVQADRKAWANWWKVQQSDEKESGECSTSQEKKRFWQCLWILARSWRCFSKVVPKYPEAP